MISFNIILPELNQFITNLGGAKYKGLIISLFGAAALISRPFSGKLSDTIGRKKVMFFGLFVALAVTLIYPISGLILFLTLRFLHGFSAGFLPTGATALVTDILPENKRGIGMGIWGTFTSVGIGAGQLFAKYIVAQWGLTGLFMIAALFVVFATIMIAFISETLDPSLIYRFKPLFSKDDQLIDQELNEPVKRFHWGILKIGRNDIIEPHVVPAAIVMCSSAVSSGIVFAVTPDMTEDLGLSNKGWFFGYYALSTIAIRLFASRLSDIIGRRKTLIIGMTFMSISMSVLALSTDGFSSMIGSIIFGIATGISSPTLFAWTADLSPTHRRGVGAGTIFIALEGGIILGSASILLTYDNTFNSIPSVFFTGVIFAIFAIGYLIWHLKNRESET